MTELFLVGPPDDYPGDKFISDINIVDGKAEELTDDDAILAQRATIAALMQKGTVPLLEDTGIDWSAYITREKTLTMMDGEVRQAIATFTGKDNMFIPEYGQDGEQMLVRLNQVEWVNK